MTIAATALTGALIYTKSVLIPFTISLFLFAILAPFFTFLQRRAKVPRALALVVTFLMFIGVTSLLSLLIVNSLGDFIEGAGVYRDRIVQVMEWGAALLSKYGVTFDTATLKKELMNLPIFTIVKNFTGGLFGIVGNTFLVVIFTLFLLLGERSKLKEGSILIPIQQNISRYVATKVLTSFGTGLIVGVTLLLLDVELALMFGLITILLNFIPSVGSIFATLLPLPIILLQFGLGLKFYLAIAIMGIVQIVIGNIVEPKLMGEGLGLHPITLLVFLIFWGLVWGIPGMFLAVPITSILKIILSKMENTKVLAELFAGNVSI